MFCSYCGHKNPDDASFCSGCGKSISQKSTLLKNKSSEDFENLPVNSAANNTDDLLSAFVGDKYDSYYRKKWFKGGQASMESKKGLSIYSFNLAGMFLGVFWLCYRKMYMIAFLMALLIPVLDIIMMHTKGEADYGSIGNLIYGMIWIFATGLLGNMLYHHHSAKKIKKIVSETTDTTILSERLATQGGTTWKGAIVAGTFAVIVIFLMYELFAPSWY